MRMVGAVRRLVRHLSLSPCFPFIWLAWLPHSIVRVVRIFIWSLALPRLGHFRDPGRSYQIFHCLGLEVMQFHFYCISLVKSDLQSQPRWELCRCVVCRVLEGEGSETALKTRTGRPTTIHWGAIPSSCSPTDIQGQTQGWQRFS